jgi:hypothetical protein
MWMLARDVSDVRKYHAAGLRSAQQAQKMLRRKLVRAALFGTAVLVVAGMTILWYAASDDLPRSSSTTLLDAIMPVYDVQEVHSSLVVARPANVYAAITAVTPGETALARPFLWVRTLPGRLDGAQSIDESVWNRPFLSIPDTAVIGRTADREIVVGLIGQFWKLQGGQRVAVQSREQFMAFNDAGFAVSTLSFHIDADGNQCRVTTITRVRATDPASRRAFHNYWRVIGTGSGLLRRTWLRAVKTRAEGLEAARL